MKRIVILLLIVSMACLPLMVSCAEVKYTLAEKMQKQIIYGNGVKGSLTIATSGADEWLHWVDPLVGKQVELRWLQQNGRFQGTIAADDEQLGQLRVYGDGELCSIYADFMKESGLVLPIGDHLLAQILGHNETTNPLWYGIVGKLSSVDDGNWKKTWEPVLAKLENRIDLWLNEHAEMSYSGDEDGNTLINVKYSIPETAIREGLKALVTNGLMDSELKEALKTCMTEEQLETYWRADLSWFYEQVIDHMEMPSYALLNKNMTSKGETISTHVELPLIRSEWKRLIIETDDVHTLIALEQDDLFVSITLNRPEHKGDIKLNTGVVQIVSGTETAEYSYRLESLTETTEADDDGRSTETYIWNCYIDPAEETLKLLQQPIRMTCRAAFSGKESQHSATTLHIEASVMTTDSALDLTAKVKTAVPWDEEAQPNLPMISVVDMSEPQKEELIQSLQKLQEQYPEWYDLISNTVNANRND